jgi:hypothetical protein
MDAHHRIIGSLLTVVAIVAVIIGLMCAITASDPHSSNTSTSGGTITQSILPPQPTMVPALCREVNGRADHTCTPGLFAHSPDVTADAPKYLHTLCQPEGSVANPKDRWIAKRRPPTSDTNKWKLQVMNAYGFRNVALKDVEGDHVAPLELDGDPGRTLGPLGLPANFYPQFWGGLTGAHVKDQEEGLLHRQVCSGGLTLQQAQDKIIRDWVH